MARLDLVEKCDPAFLHHLAVPGGLHECDALRLGKSRMRRRGRRVDGFGGFDFGGAYFGILQHLIHGVPLWDQNQGTRNDTPARKPREAQRPFSFIRTLTVGFGIAPNLLTLPPPGTSLGKKALAGLGTMTLTAGGESHPALRTSI